MPRGMMKRKKNILLLIETSRAFGRGLLQGISHHVLEHDEWNVHLETQGLLDTSPPWLKNWKGDGMIVRTASLSVFKTLRHLNRPMVELLGNGIQVRPEVRNNENMVAEQAIEHFAQSGFEHYGFFSVGNAWWTELRQNGFLREVNRRGGKTYLFPPAGEGGRVFYPNWTSRYENTMCRWLKKLPKPVGIWATSDALAIRLLQACQRIGIVVPEEAAILGTTNDVLLCNVLSPALSSIDMNSFQIGYAAAERLSQKLKGKSPPEPPVLIDPSGVVARQSTDTVALSDEIVAKAIRLIRENATSQISVDLVAREIDVSRSTLQRRFRQLTGRTVEREIMKNKMNRARRLLKETTFNLSIIAKKAGFATTDYFVQVFRRENGITPHQYRKTLLHTPPEQETVRYAPD